jgi:hypothetical protein
MSTPRNFQVQTSEKNSKPHSYSSYGRDSQVLAYSPGSNEYFSIFNKKFESRVEPTKVEDHNQSYSCSPQQPFQEDEAKSSLVCGM